MSANVFAFPSRGKGPQPWTNDELAELYRVVDLLGRAGLAVGTDMGMSDEGDPWFIFCRVDNEEVIAHFARIDGIFVAASVAVDETFRGANFRQIVDRMVSSQPLVVPPPRPGSRLFVHPAVLLTAFVATALAHSEKMHAQDWLRSVEAQWEHGKQSALHDLKQVKTSWADTLHTLFKLPAHEARLAYDSAKEGLTLTWASLIAIALTALQPIVEKVSLLSQVVDELQSYAAQTVHQTAAHAAAVAADLPILAAGDGQGQSHAAASHGDAAVADSPMAHKVALDTPSSDDAKAGIDGAHLAAPVVQKALAEDVSSHLTPDSHVDAGLTALAAQKVVSLPTQQAEAIVLHVDNAAVVVPTLNMQDLTTDAVHILNIHDTIGTSESKTGTSTSSSTGSDAASHASMPQVAAAVTETPAGTSLPDAPVHAAAPAGPVGVTYSGNDTIIDMTKGVSGSTSSALVSDFVTNGLHSVSQTVAVTDPIAQQELAGILAMYGTVKVVFFETTASYKDVFLYSPGVVWVEAKDVAGGHPSNGGGNMIIETGGAGGTVTLLGVATATNHPDSV